MKKTLIFPVTIFIALIFHDQSQALYIRPQLEATPVDRLVKNLTKQLKAKPKDVKLRFNLARVHAMAFAKKTDQATVRAGKANLGAWFGYEPRHVPFKAVKVNDAAKEKAADAQLAMALERYKEVLKMDPKHLSAQLGYGWCLEQAGKKDEAIAQYKMTIELGWAKEKDLRFAGLGWHSVVAEAAGYLTPLLDAKKDAAELATLKQRVAQVRRVRRPITPLAVPLRDGLCVADMVDCAARVRFDADGSGERKRWSWLSRDAAWLVYDQKQSGRITSALQLFGNVTFWLFWENGYQALATLDDNADGQLTGTELRYLALWRDANTNGISEPGEVTPVSAAGIVALSCKYTATNRSTNFRAMSPSGVKFKDGTIRRTYDIILHPKKP